MTASTVDTLTRRRCPSASMGFAAVLLLTSILVFARSALALDVPALVKDHRDAIVLITGLDKQNKAKQFGSGFFIDSDGLLVTNYHVIEGADGLLVNLSNGAFFLVQDVLVADRDRDLAILRVPGRNLLSLKLADSDRVRVGEDVVALGSPEGLQNSVSTGIVSGIRQDGARVLIQTTAPISHGSSGGPLLNGSGQVIGVTTLSLTKGQNLNFAIAANNLRDLITKPAGSGASLSAADQSRLQYMKGVLAENDKNYTDAERSLLEAIRLDPGNFDAWMELGGLYYLIDHTDKEVDAYKKAAQIRPRSDEAHYLLGTAYEEKGQFDIAVLEYQAAVSLNPRYKEALFDLALLSLVQGEHAQAVTTYRQLEPLNPGMARKLRRILELAGAEPTTEPAPSGKGSSRPTREPSGKRTIPSCPWGEYWSSGAGRCQKVGQ